MTEEQIEAMLDEYPGIEDPHLREMAKRLTRDAVERERRQRIESAAVALLPYTAAQYATWDLAAESAIEGAEVLIDAIDRRRAAERQGQT